MQCKRMISIGLSVLLLLGAAGPLAGVNAAEPEEPTREIPETENLTRVIPDAAPAEETSAEAAELAPELTEPAAPEPTEPAAPEAYALFRLGNDSEMLLAGGGRMVQTGQGLYFLGEANDWIYRTDGADTVCLLAQSAGWLNYIDGALYYATQDETGFSIWRMDGQGEESTCLLHASGTLRQLVAVEGGVCYYLADETVWRLSPAAAPEAIVTAADIVSFVPTGFGTVYATGELFAYDLWLEGLLLAEAAEDYYLIEDPADRRLVFSQDGLDYELSLRALLAGDGTIRPYSGHGAVDVRSLFSETADKNPEPDYESVEPQLPVTRAARPQATQKRAVTQGMINIALRAYQMTDIQWTPQRSVAGWKGQVLYQAGQSYRGLPYGQPIGKHYVPWETGLSAFLSLVNDPTSAFYTERAVIPFDGLAYALDCSGFVSWAWQTPSRLNTAGLTDESLATLVSQTGYAAAQIGDCLNDGSSHALVVTNIKYNSAGEITAIELAHANTNAGTGFCCTRLWYGSGYSLSLADLQARYFANGYALYRSHTRNSVTFTPEASVPVSHDATPTPTSTNLPKLSYGMDVSQWQGEIDWAKTSKYVQFAIIRSLYGADTFDLRFDRNVEGCIKNKVPYGVYVYGLATTTAEAAREARMCIQRLGGRTPDLPIFYDVEDAKTNLSLSNEALYQVVAAFCSTIEAAGYRAGVYSSTNFWNTQLSDVRYMKWTRWVAEWNSDIKCSYTGGLNLWQYANTAKVQGIVDVKGNLIDVDLNLWVGDLGDSSRRYVLAQNAPTCTHAGTMTYTSTDGKIRWVESLQSLGHSFYGGRCIRCGVLAPGADTTAKFQDVVAGAWYESAVQFAVQKGLFSGMSATEFAPNTTMNRAMMVTVLWRMAGSPRTVAYNPFEDVPNGKYYTAAVIWAYQTGVVNGMSATRFAPNDSITREQMAAVLYRYSGRTHYGTAELDAYSDKAGVSGYARVPMAWAIANGLIKGMSATTLEPTGTATRAQVATILMRYLQQLGSATATGAQIG